MDIRLTLHHGPIEAEVEATADEEYQEKFLELLEFIEENQDRIQKVEFPSRQTGEEGSNKSTATQTTLTESNQEDNTVTSEIAAVLEPVARKTGVEVQKLERVLFVDPDSEEPPEILIDDPSIFGDSKKSKQKPVSLILLYLWDECYGQDTVHSSDLKDALADCGIDPSNLFNIYDSKFRKSGGNNRQLSLTRSGKLQAQDEICNLIEDAVEESK